MAAVRSEPARGQARDGGLSAATFAALAVAIWIAFCILHPLIRVAFDLALGPADSLELLASQDLKLNYRPRQPPFYSWLMWAGTQAFGPTPLAVQVVKYGLMAVAGLGFFMAGLAATGDRARAALGMLMVLMVFNVGFTIHDQSTHSVGLIAGLGLLFWGYARLARNDGVATYVLIAIAGAVSVLSKHSAWLVIVAFPVAFVFVPALRPRILSVKFLLCFIVILGSAAPLLLFLLANRSAAASHLSGTLSVADGDGIGWLAPFTALGTLFGGWFIWAAPIAGLLAIAFAGVRQHWRQWIAPPATLAASDMARGLALGVALVLAIITIALLAAGAAHVPSRHLLIVVIPTALVLAWTLPAAAINGRGLMRLLVIVAGLQAATMIARVAVYAYPGQPICKRCSHVLPVPELADAIRARIGVPATLVSNARVSVGNLRTYLPDTRMVFTGLPKSAAPAPHARGSVPPDRGCYFLSLGNTATISGDSSFAIDDMRRATTQAEPVTLSLKWPRVIGDSLRETTWTLVPLPASLEVCGISRD